MKNFILFILLALGLINRHDTEEESAEYNIDQQINLKRYILKVDGHQKEFYSFTEDIDKVLEEEQVELKDQDYYQTNFIGEICSIKVVRCSEEVLNEVKEIPSNKQIKISSKLAPRKSKIIQKGRSGYQEVQYKIIYEDGREKYREIISESTIIPARTEIVVRGYSPREKYNN